MTQPEDHGKCQSPLANLSVACIQKEKKRVKSIDEYELILQVERVSLKNSGWWPSEVGHSGAGNAHASEVIFHCKKNNDVPICYRHGYL